MIYYSKSMANHSPLYGRISEFLCIKCDNYVQSTFTIDKKNCWGNVFLFLIPSIKGWVLIKEWVGRKGIAGGWTNYWEQKPLVKKAEVIYTVRVRKWWKVLGKFRFNGHTNNKALDEFKRNDYGFCCSTPYVGTVINGGRYLIK